MPVLGSRAERYIRIVVERPNDAYLIDVLSRLGPEALLHVAGLRSDQPKPPKVRVQPLSRPGIHPVGAVHITDGVVRTSLFAKVQTAQYCGAQSLERELHFLSNVAPLIALENPRLRSPLPVAYYPDLGLLLMEFVNGDSLKHHLFDATLALARENKSDLAELLQCAGRWLGTMHSLTLQESAYGNPLEWLLQEFESTRTVEAFSLYSLTSEYAELLSILHKCIDRNPMFRRNLCNVHGEFTPIHVMVAEESIYVVDFGNSKLGYRYEDVGLFAGFYDCLQPWRAAAGSLRIKLNVQKTLFYRGYFEQSETSFNEADKAIMRWVRLVSFARMLNGWRRRYNGFGKQAYRWLTLGTLRERFTQACRTEIEALRELQLDVFDETLCAGRQPGSEHYDRSADITHTATSG